MNNHDFSVKIDGSNIVIINHNGNDQQEISYRGQDIPVLIALLTAAYDKLETQRLDDLAEESFYEDRVQRNHESWVEAQFHNRGHDDIPF